MGPDHDALWRLFSTKALLIWPWNFDTILIQVLKLCYQDKDSISLIVWILWTFWHRRYFGIYSSFFIITFDWEANLKLWWLYRKYLVQIYIRVNLIWNSKNSFFIHKNQLLGENKIGLFCSFVQITFQVQPFCKPRRLYKNRLYPVFTLKKIWSR